MTPSLLRAARILLPGTLLFTAGALLAANPKLDLERVTPVPADQPVPIQDFFRAPL